MKDGNSVADFPAPQFAIALFCDACGHQASLDREKVSEDTLIADVIKHLRCSACGSREASIRIVYTGAGGFHHVGMSPTD